MDSLGGLSIWLRTMGPFHFGIQSVTLYFMYRLLLVSLFEPLIEDGPFLDRQGDIGDSLISTATADHDQCQHKASHH